MLVTFYFHGNDPDLIGNGLDLDYSNYTPGADNTVYLSQCEACQGVFNITIGLIG